MTSSKLLLDRSIHFIRAHCRNGLWPPEVGAVPNAMTTAEVVAGLGSELQPSELNGAVTALAAQQRADGSWSDPNDADPWDCSATAWTAWAVGDRLERDRRHAALSFMRRLVRSDGGLPANEATTIPNTYATAYALRCFEKEGDLHTAQKMRNFLYQVQNADGGWGLLAGAPSEQTLTMYVLDGLLEARRDDLPLQQAIDWLGKVRQADGTFGSWLEEGPSTEGTAFGLHILRKAGVESVSSDAQAISFLLTRTSSLDGFSIEGSPKVWVAISVCLAARAYGSNL